MNNIERRNDFIEKLSRKLSDMGYAVSSSAGMIKIRDPKVMVLIRSGCNYRGALHYVIGPDGWADGVKRVSYPEPKAGFDIDLAAKRIASFCDKAKLLARAAEESNLYFENIQKLLGNEQLNKYSFKYGGLEIRNTTDNVEFKFSISKSIVPAYRCFLISKNVDQAIRRAMKMLTLEDVE